MSKIAVVAGNGDSLKYIDYSRLPVDFDLFRCNQFYFEPKYYLGKKIKVATFIKNLYFEQYYTVKNLIKNKEYEIESIVCNGNIVSNDDALMRNFNKIFPDGVDGYEYIKRLKDFDAFIKFNDLYYGKRITLGVYSIALAVAMGYKKILIAGIDFYKADYAFKYDNKNFLNLLLFSSGSKSLTPKWHSMDTDIDSIKFLIDTYGVEIYSLCPNSHFSRYFPLAPVVSGTSEKICHEKPNGYINDIMIPSKSAYERLRIAKGETFNQLLYISTRVSKSFYIKRLKNIVEKIFYKFKK